MRKTVLLGLLVMVPWVAGGYLPARVNAQIVNGSFETGDLTGWTVVAGAVEVIQSSNFDTGVPVPDGTYYALLSTTPSVEDNGNGVDSGVDRDGVDGNERDVAILTQTFTVSDAPVVLRFSVAMVTDEDPEEVASDIFECLLDGTPIVRGGSALSYPGSALFPFAGPFDGVARTVTSTGPTNGSSFEYGVSSFQDVSVLIGSNGTYLLECFIGDGFNDGAADSGILLDNVRLEVQLAPIPTVNQWGVMILTLLVGISSFWLIRRKSQAASLGR